MRRRKRSWLRRTALAFALLLVAAVAATTVSVVPSRTFTLQDASGRPLEGAYVAYSYKGYRFNFVDSLTYHRTGAILRTNARGEFETPGFVHVHRPLDSALKPWIEWVYVPELHFALGPLAFSREPIPGVLEVDAERRVAKISDLTENPEWWSRTLDELDRLVSYDLLSNDLVPASEAMRQELLGHLREEYRAFMERHAETPRELTEPEYLRYKPEEERQKILAKIRESYEREPLWGQLMERRFRSLLEP